MEPLPLILALKLLTIGTIILCLEVLGQQYACNTDGQVRLVGGVHRFEGRLEVCQNGKWGTVCNDGWNLKDALVVCRQLGVENGVSDVLVNNVVFGRGDSSQLVHFEGVNCSGSEARLLECNNSGLGQHDCTHDEDVGVICDVPLQECSAGDVRLEGGLSSTEGRVEYCVGGRWGTVCNHNWNEQDAVVVCKQLGFNTFNPKVKNVTSLVSIYTPLVLDNVHCSGSEAKLADCWKEAFVEFCSHELDAGVDCTHMIECTDDDVRLVDGESDFEGRVEFCQDGHWSVVCRDGWDKADAEVVCRQLGHHLNVIALPSYFGLGSSKVITSLNQVQCSGSEMSLKECSRVESSKSITCLRPGAGVVCPITQECMEGDVRLDGGTLSSHVEVCHGGHWELVCHDSWDDADANIVCRQLGYSGGVATHNVTFDDIWMSDLPFHLDDVDCKGGESRLDECRHSGLGVHNCLLGENEIAGVICSSNDSQILSSSADVSSGTTRISDSKTILPKFYVTNFLLFLSLLNSTF